MPRDPAGIFQEDAGVQQKPRLQEPKLFRVLLHNDNYTTMDFVVKVIVSVFHKPAAEATKIMLDVHKKGHGVVGRVHARTSPPPRCPRCTRWRARASFPSARAAKRPEWTFPPS